MGGLLALFPSQGPVRVWEQLSLRQACPCGGMEPSANTGPQPEDRGGTRWKGCPCSACTVCSRPQRSPWGHVGLQLASAGTK